MAPLRRPIRRATVVVACLGLVAALAGCDSGGSGGTSAGSTTTTTKRKPHGSTTTTSGTANTSPTTGSGSGPASTTTTTSAVAAALPCATQQAALTALVQGGDLPIPVDSYTVTDCRIAPSSLIWAAVVLSPKPGQTVPKLTVVAERIGSLWNVHSYGPGATGCDAPAPVPAELRLGC